jgi:hypothetical protein
MLCRGYPIDGWLWNMYYEPTTITEHIMSKAAAIEFLEEQLLQAEAEVKAIKLVLARHKEAKPTDTLSPPPAASHSGVGKSVADITHRALIEAGKQQTTEQLLAFLATHGKPTSSATLRSSIYQFVKIGKRFKRIAPGLYGLIEWQ